MSHPLLSAIRLRTLPLAAGAIITGTSVAKSNGFFEWDILILSLSTAFLLQILSNLANDYGDFAKGIDAHGRQDRALSSGRITPGKMKVYLIINTLLALVSGVILLLAASEKQDISFWGMLILGIGCILGAFLYTMGKRPYGYYGFGDLSVFIFFGPVAVTGSCYLYTGEIGIYTLIPASIFGILSIGVLNINNIRDIKTDLEAGKTSVAAKLGFRNALRYQIILITSAYVLLCIHVFNQQDFSELSLLSFIVLFFYHLISLSKIEQDDRMAFNKQLKLLSMFCLLFSIWFFIATTS